MMNCQKSDVKRPPHKSCRVGIGPIGGAWYGSVYRQRCASGRWSAIAIEAKGQKMCTIIASSQVVGGGIGWTGRPRPSL